MSLSKQQLTELKQHFKVDLIPFDNDTVAFVAKVLDCRMTAYKSGSVLFQGNDAQTVYLTVATKFQSETLSAAGSDEVGTGDYFGPIVVCACYIDEKDYPKIKNLGLTDSKKISDDKIRELGPKLHSLLANSLLVLDNKKYNEVKALNNLNVIKAKLHNQAYINLIKKIGKLPANSVVDQFTPASKYFNYLKDEEVIVKNLLFATKAESQYPAVAAASIIARSRFLREMDKMNFKYRFIFPKGAGIIVDEAILKFIDRYPGRLDEVAKLDFKNTKKIGIDLDL